MGRLLPFILFILLILGGIFGLPFYIESDSFRDLLVKRLTETVGHPVRIEKLDAGLFPPSIGFKNLEISTDSGAPFFKADKITGYVTWGSLLKRQFVPTQVAVSDWQLTLTRLRDGAWDWSSWWPKLQASGSRVAWPLERVEWKGGKVLCKDPFNQPSRAESTIEHIAGSWQPPQQTAQARGNWRLESSNLKLNLKAQGTFFRNPSWSATLQVASDDSTANVSLRRQNGEFHLSGDSEQWAWQPLYAFLRFYTRWDGPALKEGGSLMLEQWKFQANWGAQPFTFANQTKISGGSVTFQGIVSTTSANGLAQVSWSAQTVQLTPIFATLWESTAVEGLFTGKGQFRVALSSRPWTTLQGEAEGDILRGFYRWPATVPNNLKKAHLKKYIDTKFPDLMSKGPRFQKMTLGLSAGGGFLRLNKGIVDMGDLQTAVYGEYDIERKGIESFIRLKVWEDDPALLKLIPKNYVVRNRRKLSVTPFHGRFMGSWENLKLLFVKQRSVPGRTQSILQQHLRA